MQQAQCPFCHVVFEIVETLPVVPMAIRKRERPQEEDDQDDFD